MNWHEVTVLRSDLGRVLGAIRRIDDHPEVALHHQVLLETPSWAGALSAEQREHTQSTGRPRTWQDGT